MAEKSALDLLRDGPKDDVVVPFKIENADIRGRFVRLGPSVDEILRIHDYPEPVSRLLGEALTLVAMLGSSLKFDGTFSLQTRSDGPVRMLVADFFTPGILRGYASFDEEALQKVAGTNENLLGSGHLALTVDQGAETERYQGVVELSGQSMADCAHQYFRQSEQIETSLKLSVANLFQPSEEGEPFGSAWRAGGIMIQNLPEVGGDTPEIENRKQQEEIEDSWRRAGFLLDTVSDDELTDPTLKSEELLYALFHEDGVRMFSAVPLQAGCRCERSRVESVLKRYGRADLEEMAAEDGVIRVTCEFCKTEYDFDPAEVGQD